MENQNEVNEEEELVDDFSHEDAPEDTDWKAKALEFQGRAKRLETKHKKLNEELKSLKKPIEDATPQNKNSSPSGELDKGDIAILHANQIKSPAEVALVKNIMKDTGKSLLDVLDSKYFQSELKEIRDAKAVEDATPAGSRRGSPSGRDTVDYWIAKGELPPPEMGEKLRREYVNAKAVKESNQGGHFYNSVG